MSIFASIDPASLNADPKPYLTNLGARYANHADAVSHEPRHVGGGWKPRPEFTPATTHPHNPILVAFREYASLDNFPLAGALAMWQVSLESLDTFGGLVAWDDPDHPRHALTTATPEQADHAGRVLTRLAHFTKEN